jgi:hypothetical protein
MNTDEDFKFTDRHREWMNTDGKVLFTPYKKTLSPSLVLRGGERARSGSASRRSRDSRSSR